MSSIGTPEEIAANASSYTGQYLKNALKRRGGGRAKRAAGPTQRTALNATEMPNSSLAA